MEDNIHSWKMEDNFNSFEIDEKIESFIHYIMFHGITEVYHSCDPILRLIMTDAKLNIKIINRQQINTTVITKRAS